MVAYQQNNSCVTHDNVENVEACTQRRVLRLLHSVYLITVLKDDIFKLWYNVETYVQERVLHIAIRTMFEYLTYSFIGFLINDTIVIIHSGI